MDFDLLNWIIQHGYIFMFLIMLVEGPLVTTIGAFGAALGYFNVFGVFILSFFANFLPDLGYYGIGIWGGSRILDRFGERLGIPPSRRERAAQFIANNMGKWLFFLKAVPLFSPPGLAIMGALGVPIKRFIWWDAFMVAITSLFFVVLGFYSGKGFDIFNRLTQYGTFGLIGIFLSFIVITHLYSRIARRFTRRVRDFTREETAAN